MTLECRHPLGCRPACVAAYAIVRMRITPVGPRIEENGIDERDDGSCGHCM